MLVREIMTSPAYSVHEGTNLEEVLKLMATAKVTCIPVVDDAERVIGVISEADLLKAALEPDPRAHARLSRQPGLAPSTVAQVMTAHPYTVREDSDVADLAHTFVSTSFKSVPVVRGEILLGVVSRSDVIRALARTDQQIAAEITSTLAQAGLQSWYVEVNAGVVHVMGGNGSDRERAAVTSVAQSVRGVRHVASLVADA
jgi:CBS domain-containing protein